MNFLSFLNALLRKILGIEDIVTTTTTTTTIDNATTTSTTTDTTTTKSGRKRALCMGINNYNGNSNLWGCVNDAKEWSKLLSEKYGFEVETLLDFDVTKTNIKNKLSQLSELSQSGDQIVITYSGHGSSIPDYDGDEADGRDETWFLSDGHFCDDEIRESIGKVKDGVILTIISDSCHSGTVTRSLLSTMNDTNVKPRYMPPDDDMESVAINSLPVKKAIFCPEESMKEILISGCKSNEYSYDSCFNSINMGAFSYYSLTTLKNNPNITYKDFYAKLREQLPSSQYPQTPQLEGSETMKNKIMFQ